MPHLKRIRAPRSWTLKQRKGVTFIARPLPGSHKLSQSVTLNCIVKEMLTYAKTTKEVKLILHQGKILGCFNDLEAKSSKR